MSLSRVEAKMPILTKHPGKQHEALVRQNAVLRAENAKLKQRITELEQHVRLALRDPLTGLHNRRYWDETLRQEVASGTKKDRHPFSVLMIDVNNLKEINDQSGHRAGDKVLQWIGAFLESSVRVGDVTCRYGGDEFLILLRRADAEQAARLVKRLEHKLEKANRWRRIPISLSIGSATFGVDGNNADALIAHADAAMYADKRAKKTKQAISTVDCTPSRRIGDAEHAPA